MLLLIERPRVQGKLPAEYIPDLCWQCSGHQSPTGERREDCNVRREHDLFHAMLAHTYMVLSSRIPDLRGGL